jgi:valyl-tRNA synthetase
VTRLESQLANPGFIAGAPARVVDEARRRLAEAIAQMEVLRRPPTGGRIDGG